MPASKVKIDCECFVCQAYVLGREYASVDNVEKEEPPFDYKKWANELRSLFKNYDDSGNVV